MANILLTSIGGTMMPILIKYLKNDINFKNLKIYGVDKRKVRKNKDIEKIYKISSANQKIFIKKILNITNENKISLVIPFSDEEARIFSKFKGDFKKKKIKIMVNDYKTINLISNKFKTYQILKKNNITMPLFFLSKNLKNLEKHIKNFIQRKKEFVIKPLNSRGGRGIIICSKYDDKRVRKNAKRIKFFDFSNFKLNRTIFKFGPVIIMEKLYPPAYDVDCLVVKKKIYNVFRERVNQYGIPYLGNKIVNVKKNFNIKKIVKILNLNHLSDLDFFSNKAGKPVLIEVNPRPSGSISMCYKKNIPIFSYAISKFLKVKYPELNLNKK